jgi:glycoprotein 6-alpha-L-fucosyltransferase
MQARLHALQNPSKPCTDVKRAVCNINKGCGYGCEIHHAMHCFHIAYALGRPMILLSGIHLFFYITRQREYRIRLLLFSSMNNTSVAEGWRYNPGGFDQIFLSPSDNCTKSMVSSVSSWGKDFISIIFFFNQNN